MNILSAAELKTGAAVKHQSFMSISIATENDSDSTSYSYWAMLISVVWS